MEIPAYLSNSPESKSRETQQISTLKGNRETIQP